MDTAGVFQYPEPGLESENNQFHQLWMNTWERIDCFLPGLRNQVFTPQEIRKSVPYSTDVCLNLTSIWFL